MRVFLRYGDRPRVPVRPSAVVIRYRKNVALRQSNTSRILRLGVLRLTAVHVIIIILKAGSADGSSSRNVIRLYSVVARFRLTAYGCRSISENKKNKNKSTVRPIKARLKHDKIMYNAKLFRGCRSIIIGLEKGSDKIPPSGRVQGLVNVIIVELVFKT